MNGTPWGVRITFRDHFTDARAPTAPHRARRRLSETRVAGRVARPLGLRTGPAETPESLRAPTSVLSGPPRGPVTLSGKPVYPCDVG